MIRKLTDDNPTSNQKMRKIPRGQGTKKQNHSEQRVICDLCTNFHYRHLKNDMEKVKTYRRNKYAEHIACSVHLEAIKYAKSINMYNETMCPVCHVAYQSEFQNNHLFTKKHVKAANAMSRGAFFCDLCNISFRDKFNLKRHEISDMHKKNIEFIASSSSSSSSSSSASASASLPIETSVADDADLLLGLQSEKKSSNRGLDEDDAHLLLGLRGAEERSSKRRKRNAKEGVKTRFQKKRGGTAKKRCKI
jgi:hypothetical protein